MCSDAAGGGDGEVRDEVDKTFSCFKFEDMIAVNTGSNRYDGSETTVRRRLSYNENAVMSCSKTRKER